jgi:hypothetical protein
MGLPMVFVVVPYSWWSLPAVILIEAMIARLVYRIPTGQSAKMSAVANIVSTVVGIPITWVLMLAGQMFFNGTKAHGIDTFWEKLFAITIQSPWLIPYEDDLHWMVPAAAAFLCIPFFIMSVFIEAAIGCALVPKSMHAKIRSWSWLANAITYGIIVICLVILTIRAYHKY